MMGGRDGAAAAAPRDAPTARSAAAAAALLCGWGRAGDDGEAGPWTSRPTKALAPVAPPPLLTCAVYMLCPRTPSVVEVNMASPVIAGRAVVASRLPGSMCAV